MVEVWAECPHTHNGQALPEHRQGEAVGGPDRQDIKQTGVFWEAPTLRGWVGSRPSSEDEVTHGAPGPSPAKAPWGPGTSAAPSSPGLGEDAEGAKDVWEECGGERSSHERGV